MSQSVEHVLAERLRLADAYRLKAALGWAVALHLLVTAGLLVVPALVRPHVPPPKYVAVQVVSAAALGLPRQAPARPTVTRPPAPPPTPAAKPEPKSTPAPLPATKSSSGPVLPSRRRPEPARPRVPEVAAPSAPAEAATGKSAEAPAGIPGGRPGGMTLGAAVAGLDNPSFTYGYYLDQMLAMIQSRWARPPLGSGVEAIVAFRIRRDGTLAELRIERSSGFSSFDLAGLRAVQSAAPLPPLPRGYTHDSLGVNLILN